MDRARNSRKGRQKRMRIITDSNSKNQIATAAISRRRQRDLFRAGLPDKPYCMTAKDRRTFIRPLHVAQRYPYIQINAPWLTVAMTFDIDRAGGAGAWVAADLPEPLASATNRANEHAHIIYALAAPVITGMNARQKPLTLLSAIQGAMTERLNADPGYSGLIAKNPLSRKWRNLWSTQPARYELKFLREFIGDKEIERHLPRAKNRAHLTGAGRNVEVFTSTRWWAYRAIKDYLEARIDEWHDAVMHRVLTTNADYPNPMSENECRHIGKHISKWTWQKIAMNNTAESYEQTFIAIQTARGRRSGKARRKATADRDAAIIAAAAGGMTQRTLAAEFNMSRGGITRILQRGGL